MDSTPHELPLNLRTDDVQANIWLLAHKDKFLHHLRDTGEVDHALLQNFVASLVHAYQQNAYHADRAWRMTTSELVKAHVDWLDAVQDVLKLPHGLLAPLDAVRHRDR
jgi:uncharacterized protein (DUF2461 family)